MPFLSQRDRQQIHQASMEVLGSVGVRVDHSKVLILLEEAGARVDMNAGVAYLSEKLVRDSVERCPPVVRLSDLDGHITELTPGGKSIFWPGNALYLVKDKNREEITTRSFVRLTRVMDALENVHAMIGTSIADYPPPTRDFVGFRLMAENTIKHLRPCIYTPSGPLAIMEMADVLLNGRPYRDFPIFSLGYSIMSPLHWTETALQVFINSSGHGIPIMINAEPMAGGTSPVSLAGSLVLANAEVLSGIVICQLLEPGRPCVYNPGFAHVFDMRTTLALTGAPECALMSACGAEMGQFYGLPSASWMSTESMLVDPQASLEKMMTGLVHSLSHVNIIWGIGQLESQLSLSMEQAVIDNDIATIIYRIQRGVKVDKETLTLDLIREMGFQGDYLSTEHTLQHFKEELSFLEILNRDRREEWEKKGAKSCYEEARERVQAILKSETKEYLRKEQKRELERIERKWMRMVLEGR